MIHFRNLVLFLALSSIFESLTLADTSTTGDGRVVENPTSNGDLKFRVKIGSTPTDVFTLTGSSGLATFTAGIKPTAASNTIGAYNDTTSYTPEFQPTSGAWGSATYNNQVGLQLKIGRLVYVQFYLNIPNTWTLGTAAGIVRVSLPYTARNVSNALGALACDHSSIDLQGSAVRHQVSCQVQPGSTQCILEESGDNQTGANTPVATLVGDALYLICSGTYISET